MEIILNARKEEEMLSSFPKIFADLQLLNDFFSNTTLEFHIIHRQVADVEKHLEDTMQMVSSTGETAKELQTRLLQAAAATNNEEPKEDK